MIRFGLEKTPDIGASIQLGLQAAAAVTAAINKPPVKLEFEKVFQPFLLMNKKRYIAQKWTRVEQSEGVVSMGTESKRRDNCKLASELFKQVSDRLMIDGDRDGALELIRDTIRKLMTARIDLGKLVITKELSKERYAGAQPHVEVVKKMKKRDPSTAPKLGERVPYIVIAGAKGSNVCANVDHPIAVMNQGLSPDPHYYLEHQLRKPLERLLEHVIGKSAVGKLFASSTNTVKRTLPQSFALKGFFKPKPRCVECNQPAPDAAALCANCQPRAEDIYSKKVYSLQALETQHWTLHQRCEACSARPEKCQNIDCDIFFKRTAMLRDIEDAHKHLNRFK